MKLSKCFTIAFLLTCLQSELQAQGFDYKSKDLATRYKNDLFKTIDSTIDLQYGEAINLKGDNEKLLLNLFTPPSSDTVKKRPLILFIHGGGFRNNTKSSSFSNRLGIQLGKRGFVVASIEYRLGIEKTNTNKDYHEAMFRAQQDARAAVRFFRKNATTYGVDTSQIFLVGSSAGSMTALAVGYMDADEVPADIDQSKWGDIEGNSGNPGYSSKVHGVFNFWGSVYDYKWIQQGDIPLFNTAGTADKTVPYDSSYDYHSFKYGPYILYQHCLNVGIPTAWVPFYGAGHSLDNNKQKLDTALNEMYAFLYTQLKVVKSKSDDKVTKWENDIAKFDSLNNVQKDSKKSVLFLGSSYIRLWENIRTDLEYKNIIHRGFGGSNLRDVAYYIKRIVYPHQPKAIFMYVGNDITDTEKDRSPIQVLELFKYTVKMIREKYPTVPVTWLAISPSEKRWGAWDKVQEANTLIQNYCASEPNLHYINFQNSFLGSDGLPIKSLFREDKLHYNIEGYKVWGNAIKDQVKAIINQ
jgi:lysophospholipase L1-like esterase/predicted esterase